MSNILNAAPASEAAEKAVLGCVMIDAQYSMPEVCELTPDMFYHIWLRRIFICVTEMWTAGEAIDMVTIAMKLKSAGQIDEAGGYVMLSKLADCVASAASVTQYVDIVKDQYQLRKAYELCMDTVKQIEERPSIEVLDSFEQKAMAIRLAKKGGYSTASEAVRSYTSWVHDVQSGKIDASLKTGFRPLDDLVCGVRPSEMILIAARPSAGKTTFMMNIAINMATGVDMKRPAAGGIFSLETPKEVLVDKACKMFSGVFEKDIARWASDDCTRMLDSAKEFAKLPLLIDDTAGIKLLELCSRARRMKADHDIKWLAIDYLQLISHATKGDNRQNAVAEISQTIKWLGQELGIPVIALVQLNRNIEFRSKDSRPKLSDLRESGSLEQDADKIFALHRIKASPGGMETVLVCVLKSKRTGLGDIPLDFNKAIGRMTAGSVLESTD